MTLSAALNTARSSLQATQTQISVVSRNTAGSSDPYYSRKIASVISQGGAVQVTISRASNLALYSKMLVATSGMAGNQAITAGLDQLNATIGDTALNASPAAKIGMLKSALSQLAKAPDSSTFAKAFLNSASDLVKSLNDATAEVQKVRHDADTAIANSVGRINGLLTKFEAANQEVMRGYALGSDISDSLDARDALISQLSEEMGVQIVEREGGDLALYTDSGVPLFDRSPRKVSFQPTSAFGPSTVGNAVFIDGIQVTGAGAPMPLNTGNLVGQAKIRDDISVGYQSQLDELARNVIEAFKETDQSGAGLPDLAGVFSFAGSIGVPPNPAPSGLAGLLKLNPALAGQPDGGLAALRDGGINGAAYRHNPAAPGSDVAFSGRLYGLMSEMEKSRPVDPAFGFGATQSLQDFASSSAGWLQGLRASAKSEATYSEMLLSQASEAMSNATDVNGDDETARMLQLEHAYSASAKLISTINEMMKTLLAMV